MVSGVGWTPSNEVFACSDDRSLRRYGMAGEALATVCELEYFVTAMRWLTTVKGGQLSADCLALACSDGALRLMGSNGRVERVIAGAHTGSCLCVAWSADGASLLTGGEDGLVKQWSRSGHLRSKVALAPSAVTSVGWSPDGERFAYTAGRQVTVASAAQNSTAAAPPPSWTAHAGAVLCSDWHPLTGQLLTGGEDGCYRVWSEEGELVFASRPFDFPVSAVRWSPRGQHFAVGAFNLVALCDAAGWSYSRHRVHTGSVLALDWSGDGTHLCGGGANGRLLFAQLIDRHSEWRHFSVRLTEKNSLAVFDLSAAAGKEGATVGAEAIRVEELDFTSPVIDWGLAHSTLVVVTAAACHVFKAPHFSSAAVVEVKGAVELLLQSERGFALVDSIRGVQMYSYDGKLLQTLRLPPSVALSSLHSSSVHMTGDLLLVAGKAPAGSGGGAGGVIHVLDCAQSRKVCEPIRHPLEVRLLTASQTGPVDERQVAFIDHNRDLYVCSLGRASASSASTGAASANGGSGAAPVRLMSSVDHCRWNETCEVLAAIGEGQVRCFFLPLAPSIDPDCLPLTAAALLTPALPQPRSSLPSSAAAAGSAASSALGSHASLSSFSGARCVVRSSSGTLLALSVSPFPLFLHRCQSKGEWSRALRLCRLLSSHDETRLCWALLYGLAVQAGQLELAQQSAAQLDWADKVRSLSAIQSIPSEAGRMGALAAYQRQFDRAESIFLAAQLPYRAIRLHLERCQWLGALQLARKQQCHVDTVLLARRLQLQALQRSRQAEGQAEAEAEEPLEEFRAMQAVQVDAAAVAAKVKAEWAKEQGRGQAYHSTLRTQSQHLLDRLCGGGEDRRSEAPAQAAKWEGSQQQTPSDVRTAAEDDSAAALEL